MICEQTVKRFCCEDFRLIENYESAVKDTTQTWCCHHRLEINPFNSDREDRGIVTPQQLKSDGMYYHRPANELIFLTRSDHISLHNSGRIGDKNPLFGKHHSEEARQKMSKSKRGRKRPPFSEEWRRKLAEAHKGKKMPPCSAETRRKLAEAARGKVPSEETRRKMSASHKSENLSIETKRKLSQASQGRKWWHNGATTKLSKDCPGPNWLPGRK